MSIASELIALIAPPACAACGAAVPAATTIVCAVCLRELPRLGRCCPQCALPSHRGRVCPAAGAAFTSAWALAAYRGPARALVRALKFDARVGLAEVMAAQMAGAMPRPERGMVVPVPASPWRRRRRGFDPAELLARRLQDRLGIGFSDCLRRTGRAPRQVGARRSDRRRRDRIRIEAEWGPPVAILVDDVHTTGATLDACARALRAAGTLRVEAVTYARTL